MRVHEMELQFIFHETVLPKGCRVPRKREQLGSVKVEVPSPTEAEAPVAMVLRQPDEQPVQIRLFEGVLYKNTGVAAEKAFFHDGWWPDLVPDPARVSFEPAPVSSDLPKANDLLRCSKILRELEDSARRWAGKRIVVEGRLWARSPEPRYDVEGCGLLRIAYCHGGWANTFSAKEKTEAIRLSERRTRGWDPLFSPYVTRELCEEAQIDVLLPEAVATPSSSELRRAASLADAHRKLETAKDALDECEGLAEPLAEVVDGLKGDVAEALSLLAQEHDGAIERLAKRFGRGKELSPAACEKAKKLVENQL